jgi:hypothetical protein
MFARGLPDGDGLATREIMLENARSVAAAVDLPVTADLENGWAAVLTAAREAVEQGTFRFTEGLMPFEKLNGFGRRIAPTRCTPGWTPPSRASAKRRQPAVRPGPCSVNGVVSPNPRNFWFPLLSAAWTERGALPPRTSPKMALYGSVAEPRSQKTAAGRSPTDACQTSFSGKSIRIACSEAGSCRARPEPSQPKLLNSRGFKNSEGLSPEPLIAL